MEATMDKDITIEISIGENGDIPEHEGYYYTIDDAIEALIKMKEVIRE